MGNKERKNLLKVSEGNLSENEVGAMNRQSRKMSLHRYYRSFSALKRSISCIKIVKASESNLIENKVRA